MKNLLEFILNHIVDHPEDIQIEESEDDRGLLYTIHVHADDIGKVIGREGRVIQAIRTLARVRAVKEKVRAFVTVAEPEGRERPRPDHSDRHDRYERRDTRNHQDERPALTDHGPEGVADGDAAGAADIVGSGDAG
jgi:predicted RNA-binding protein YlqC (UPF0109 family)